MTLGAALVEFRTLCFSLPRRNALAALAAMIVVWMGLTFVGSTFATQIVAAELNYAHELGEPALMVSGTPIYWPLSWSTWLEHFGPARAPLVFASAMVASYGSFLVGFFLGMAAFALCALRGTPPGPA